MASTGVQVTDAAAQTFEEFKKNSNTSKFVIFKIVKDPATIPAVPVKGVKDQGKDIIVAETVSDDADYSQFLQCLTEESACYALYKNDFITSDNRENTKLVFVAWIPDNLGIKSKMLYAGSKAAILQVLTGVAVKINATDRSEVTKDIIDGECRKFN